MLKSIKARLRPRRDFLGAEATLVCECVSVGRRENEWHSWDASKECGNKRNLLMSRSFHALKTFQSIPHRHHQAFQKRVAKPSNQTRCELGSLKPNNNECKI